MANAIYPACKTGLLSADLDLLVATIKCALIRGYTYDAADEFMSDVLATGTIVDDPVILTTIDVAGGVVTADDLTFTTVASGTAIPAIVMYQSSAVGGGADVATSAQRLICYLDDGIGLPYTPNDADIYVQWSGSIFSL